MVDIWIVVILAVCVETWSTHTYDNHLVLALKLGVTPTAECRHHQEQVSTATYWCLVWSISESPSVLHDWSPLRLSSNQDSCWRYPQDGFLYKICEYPVMSFGLMNVLPHFMYLKNFVFMPELNNSIVVFIDDIVVYSKSMEEHEGHFWVLLQWLWEHQLHAKFSKCEFWIHEVPFLDHVISPEGIMVDPSKVRDVLD
jgi:hypothetical protein